MGKIKDRHINVYKSNVDELRTALGRTIYIYHREKNTGITWDEAGNEPVDPADIPDAWVETEYKVEKALIRYARPDSWMVTAAGKYDPGDVVLTCKLEDVLVDKSNLNGKTLFSGATRVSVDGEDYEVHSPAVKGGLRDLYNCRVVLKKQVS